MVLGGQTRVDAGVGDSEVVDLVDVAVQDHHVLHGRCPVLVHQFLSKA